MDVPCFEQVWLKPVICIRYYMNMSIDDMSVKKDHIFWGYNANGSPVWQQDTIVFQPMF